MGKKKKYYGEEPRPRSNVVLGKSFFLRGWCCMENNPEWTPEECIRLLLTHYTKEPSDNQLSWFRDGVYAKLNAVRQFGTIAEKTKFGFGKWRK